MEEQSYRTISVVGLGYIGLPTAAMFASKKIMVVGLDVRDEVVDTINDGRIHIVEPDLDIAVRDAVQSGFLRATKHAEAAEAFVIAVPTPFDKGNQTADLSYIEAACTSIAPVLKAGDLVVLESTSPVGTTEKIADWLKQLRPDLSFPQEAGEDSDIRIAYCPERVLPGQVIHELVSNDRVIGGMTKRCSERALQLYRLFVAGECFIASSPRTAEMAKLTENSFRDVNIAFANELSMICDELQIDVWELIQLANRHPRVNILQPGAGVGGHCIAVDPWFIVAAARQQAQLIRTAREVNDSKPKWIIKKIETAIDQIVSEGKRRSASEVSISCYGIAFKPDIDDLRDSPALEIVRQVRSLHSGEIMVVEPNVEMLPTDLHGVELVSQAIAFEAGDLHVLLVDHSPFKLSSPPARGRIIDARGIWEKA